ncbi:MAG: Gfo/Idh/MocA family oxidoreductase [Promethearchaeota archaeon]|nr:MAG: Gfo/Idh/MocA family oxidoreductase [Candidatus Lokiarchaeota archaeon]
MKKVNIGIIGCGNIANIHVLGLKSILEQELYDIEILAASDVDKERLNNFGKRNQIEKLYDIPEDLINDNEIDTIYICTPTKYHKKYVLQSLQKNKHVFCEKPVATNLNDVEELRNVARSTDVISQVGFVIRYSPLFENFMEEFLNNNDLGRIMTIMFRDDQKFPIGGKYKSSWRAKKEITGGGTLIEHSIHDIDAIMAMTESKIKKLYCQTKYFSKFDVEDLAIINFELENNISGTLTSCWHNIKRDERLIEIFFENGWLRIEITPKVDIQLKIGDNKTQKLKANRIQRDICEKKGLNPNYVNFPYYYEDLEFISSINNNTKPKTGFEEALVAHKVIDAAYKSAELDKIINIDY